MNIKPTNATSPADYLAQLPEPRKTEIEKLHNLIRKEFPGLKPHIMFGMLGYGQFHYKYASGREGVCPYICLASQKNYISVYVYGVKDGEYVAERHQADFPKASIGKSCIRFKKLADVDLGTLTAVLHEGVKFTPHL